MEHDVSRGVRAGVVAYLVWGLLTVYWKQLTDFDPFELIGWRVAMAAIVMTGVITWHGRWPVMRAAFRDRNLVGRLVFAAVLLTVNWTTYVWAVVNDHVIETALGYFMSPLGTMAVGVLVLGERLTPLKKASIGFAVMAVVVLTMSYGQVPVVAVLIGASWTTYGLTKRRVPLTAIESLAGETFVLVVPATAIVLWGASRTDGVPATASTVEWALVFGTGIVTAVPLLLFAFAAKRVPFTLLGPLTYLVPIINFGLGWMVYGETLPPDRVIGFALVWIALALATFDTAQSSRRVRNPQPAAAT
ncbi:MAG: EamA family transporter RarD [Ilumatobacteraceae bacterium]